MNAIVRKSLQHCRRVVSDAAEIQRHCAFSGAALKSLQFRDDVDSRRVTRLRAIQSVVELLSMTWVVANQEDNASWIMPAQLVDFLDAQSNISKRSISALDWN